MNVALSAAISLFAGVGGLDLGAGLRLPHRVVCYVEREAFAGAVLVARMESGGLDQAPVWSDVTTFDGGPWRGAVDLILASPPCQPYSVAGKRLGLDDERGAGVLEHVARIIGEVQPAAIFLENVSQWVTGGYFRDFGEQLQRMGYCLPPAVILSAGDVGAAHRRERMFILAYRDDIGRDRLAQWAGVRHDDAERRPDADRCSRAVADAGSWRPAWTGERSGEAARAGARADPAGSGLGLPFAPPGPGDADGWRYVLERWPWLAPAIPARVDRARIETGIRRALRCALPGRNRRARRRAAAAAAAALGRGIADATAESGVLRMADGLAVDMDRRHRLRATGNGVFPLAAAVALDALLADAGRGEE